MTPEHLERITEAIAADERTTEVSNWPLSRERTRLYLALARACADAGSLPPRVWAALIALAPDTEEGTA